jgi:hypothetical protein
MFEGILVFRILVYSEGSLHTQAKVHDLEIARALETHPKAGP